MSEQQFGRDSVEITEEKKRITNRLKSMSKEEVCSIWNALVECEQQGIEQPENYRPGIPFEWWVGIVYYVRDLKLGE